MTERENLEAALLWIMAEPDAVLEAVFSEALSGDFIEAWGDSFKLERAAWAAPLPDGGWLVVRLGERAPHCGSRPLIVAIEETDYAAELVRAIPAYVFTRPGPGGGQMMGA